MKIFATLYLYLNISFELHIKEKMLDMKNSSVAGFEIHLVMK